MAATPPSEARKVIFRDTQGRYRSGFHIELNNFSNPNLRPSRMNYLIDGETGEIVRTWNQMHGFQLKNGKPSPTPVEVVTGAAQPNVKMTDVATTTSEINLERNVAIQKLKLSLNLTHTYRGDLKVTLTSPSGKQHVVVNRIGAGENNIRQTFDLSRVFAGETTQGKWTLTVEDKDRFDTGTLKSWSLSATGSAAPVPPRPSSSENDLSRYSGTVEIQAEQNADGTFSMRDNTRGKGIETRDAANGFPTDTAFPVVTDNNNVWAEDADSPRQKSAVDAHFGAQMTYDFYRDILGRDSIDGQGEKLISNVHVGDQFPNAFWNGSQMFYGDGDDVLFSSLTTLDIAGHEITHGLTERSGGLIYAGESGGLNEAMSDIMGVGLEWYASQKNKSVKFDWTMGEDAFTPNNSDASDGLRYLNDPTKDGYSIDHYSQFPNQTEVHGSSGIANNAFYLLAEGGKNRTSGLQVAEGIGIEKSLRIFGRALTKYMTPQTTFIEAREATLLAATDLFGADSSEVKRVKECWTAVGVDVKPPVS